MISPWLVLILMFFAHIVDDFYLQGILAKMKQKAWWYSDDANAPEEEYSGLHEPNKRHIKKMYRYDYIVALIVHALSWSIMILLPVFAASAWNPGWYIYLMLGVNLIIHAIIDDQKANKLRINLIVDQTVHACQILATWAIWYAFI